MYTKFTYIKFHGNNFSIIQLNGLTIMVLMGKNEAAFKIPYNRYF